MKHSDSLASIAPALVLAQAEMPVVPFDAKNDFLKNRYATLGSVIDTVRPVLSRHGLAVSQYPCGSGGQVGVCTVLIHTSGEWMSHEMMMPLGDEKGKSLAQLAGSIVTYLRRYSLAAVLGIYSDEDSDAQVAQQQRAAAQPEPVLSPEDRAAMMGQFAVRVAQSNPPADLDRKTALNGALQSLAKQNIRSAEELERIFIALMVETGIPLPDGYKVSTAIPESYLYEIANTGEGGRLLFKHLARS